MGFFWNRKKKEEEPSKASEEAVVEAEQEEEAVEEAADIDHALEKAEKSMDEGLKRLQKAFEDMQREVHQIVEVNKNGG